VKWLISMRPGKRRVLDKGTSIGALVQKIEKLKASMLAKVE
jgi:IS5 family transposase